MEEPIKPQATAKLMNSVASAIDNIFNGENLQQPKYGFALLIFPFDKETESRTNYVSNCNRTDILAAMKEFIARNEGTYVQHGESVQ